MTTQLDRLAAARQALAELGVTVAELHDSQRSDHIPTLGEYLPTVVAAAGPGANRTYGTYWARMATTWGHRRLDELLASDIEAMKNTAAKPPDPDDPVDTDATPANTSSPQPAPSTTAPSPTTSSTTNTAQPTGS